MRGKVLQTYKDSLTITQQQTELLIGTVLGDGNMRIPGRNKNANLIISHGEAQKAYVFWKYQILKSLVITPPSKEERVFHKDKSRILTSYRFLTMCHPELTKLYKLFYENGKKVIPKNIENLLYYPFSLAVWVMDDGNKNHKALFLNTQNFSFEDQMRLIDCLKNNFGLEAKINKHSKSNGKQLYRLRLSTESTKKLSELIGKFILPELSYKLPL